MSASRFRVLGRLDSASRPLAGTVTIDRIAGTFAVRPIRRRRQYVLPLSDVATLVCQRVVMAEVRAAKADRAARKRGAR